MPLFEAQKGKMTGYKKALYKILQMIQKKNNKVLYKGEKLKKRIYKIEEVFPDGEAAIFLGDKKVAHILFDLYERKGKRLRINYLMVFEETNRKKRMGTELLMWLLEKYGLERTISTWAKSEDRNAEAQEALVRFYKNFRYGRDSEKQIFLDGIDHDPDGEDLTPEEEEEIWKRMFQ